MKGFNIHFTEKISGVYAFVHIATGRLYVGSTVNIYSRFSKHISALKAGKHHSPMLQNGWNKHGESEFYFTILQVTQAEKSAILEAEQFWIDRYSPFYNTCKTATSVLGIRRSEKTKALMSAALLGRVKSDEHIEKIRQTSIGRTHSDETKRLCGIAAKKAARPKHTPERIAQNAEARSKCYVMTRPDGTELRVKNLRQFCRDNALNQGNLGKVLRGAATHHKGWKVRYDLAPL